MEIAIRQEGILAARITDSHAKNFLDHLKPVLKRSAGVLVNEKNSTSKADALYHVTGDYVQEIPHYGLRLMLWKDRTVIAVYL